MSTILICDDEEAPDVMNASWSSADSESVCRAALKATPETRTFETSLPVDSLRILLIERDEVSAHALERLLNLIGHHVTALRSTCTALSIAVPGIFDVLICDTDFIRESKWAQMKSAFGRWSIPAIELGSDEKDWNGSGQSEFIARLEKPICFDHLQDLLIEVAKHRQLVPAHRPFG